MAKLYFTYSAMNAGKSAILLQAAHNYRERGLTVSLWTSANHAGETDAETGEIESRIGLKAPARIFREDTDLFAEIAALKASDGVDAVFVDEAQFLTPDQVWRLACASDDLGVPVLCYGLRTDFQGALFDGAAALLAMADDLREVRTICHCGRKATMNLRTDAAGAPVREGEQVRVDKTGYLALCRRHWREALGRG